jgi:ribonuclease Z
VKNPLIQSARVVVACLMARVLVLSAIAQAPQTSAAVTVTLLGTGSPTPSAERMGPCTLVEAGSERLLFDAGRGCVIRAAQARIPWRELTKVFLTHLHADHTFALSDLHVMGWVLGRTEPFEVYGPPGTSDMLTSMVHAVEPDIASRLRSVPTRRPPAYRATEIGPGVVYDRGGMKVTAFDVPHSISPAFGYRIDVNGRSIVLSGDTRYSETLIQNAQGVDVIVHEVVFGSPGMTTEQQSIASAHTLPDKAGQVFAAAKPKLAIYSHLLLFGVSDDDVMAATRKVYDGRVEMGTDLTVIELGDVISVRRPK